ncbi:MAG: Hint domain-containing protein [Rhodobacteraceae bacterium]|nr:Hint domain-containing protein [Paracoccaceae bacterium]
MPIEGFYVYSAADFGLSSQFDFFFQPASATVSGQPDLLTMNDDDVAFNDEGNTAGSSQILDTVLTVDGSVVGFAGDVVQNVGQSVLTNLSSGETGLLILVQVNGAVVGFASTISLDPADSLELGAWLGSQKTIPYADLVTAPACFTRGTLILTESGEQPIESLAVGDRVMTKDHGMQVVCWIGKCRSLGLGSMAPVCFQPGAMGNTRALMVSPMHRMLVSGGLAELLFGEAEVLVPASALINGDTIYRQPSREVDYYHVMFARHEIIFSEGCPSESFAAESEAIGRFGRAAHAEILELFPELRNDCWPDARPVLNPAETALLRIGPVCL